MAQPVFKQIDPINPVAPYLGGKRLLAKTIIPMINAHPHTTYAEPFIGMGGIFFRRNKAPKAECINDRSGDVANLFRILQRHFPQFMDCLRFQITSREHFNRLIDTPADVLTDLERAARFLYLQRTAFGGKVSGKNFGVSVERPARFNITQLENTLNDAHERLASVVIENLDWVDFVQRYDRPSTLFYLDPPYWGCENDDGKELFSRDQFALMADMLSKIKGKFILSLNDKPEVRDLFSAFNLKEVQLRYSINIAKKDAARELIITNLNAV